MVINTTLFLIQVREVTQCLAGNLFANKDTSVESAIHSVSLSFYPHIIEHRHEDDSFLELLWFAHFVHELLVLLIPHLCLYSQKDFQQDIGHLSDLDQKQSGILLILTDHKENGTESLNR